MIPLAPIRSGKGLQPGDGGYNGSFKDNMQKIITSLKQSNKVPILAKVPFGKVSAARDRLIRDYNVVIDELVAANNIVVTPPDFYAYFKLHPEQLVDDVRPDGQGYQAMADLWFDALIGSGILNP
jgi:lysophospholipase L1-like esterase